MEAAFKGEFFTNEEEFAEKLSKVKLWLFDWDGVFHRGAKSSFGESSFSEVDSMGINLLRFATYLNHGKLAPSIIVTGVNNPTASYFAQREHFDSIFLGAKNKIQVLDFVCEKHGVQPEEIGFFFDDVLDINVAEKVGVRFLISNGVNPMTVDFMRQRECFDYASAYGGGFGGLRECSELALTLMGTADEVLAHRTDYSTEYTGYWEKRQSVFTRVFTVDTFGVRLLEQVPTDH